MRSKFVIAYLPIIRMWYQSKTVSLYFQITKSRGKMSKNIQEPYTKEEIRARIEQAERESAEGLGIDSEEMIRQLKADFAKEDIKSNIY